MTGVRRGSVAVVGAAKSDLGKVAAAYGSRST